MEQKIKWTEGRIIDTFKLHRVKEEHPLLEAWLDVKTDIFTAHENALIQDLQEEIEEALEGWNEEDLKMHLISAMLRLAHIRALGPYKAYYERVIEAVVEKQHLRVQTDMLIATGVVDYVKAPYFYFQEYKKEKAPSTDPDVQLLLAFLIGQQLNPKPIPLYGTTVVGDSWKFYILDKKELLISRKYLASREDDFREIIAILRKYREEILPRLVEEK